MPSGEPTARDGPQTAETNRGPAADAGGQGTEAQISEDSGKENVLYKFYQILHTVKILPEFVQILPDSVQILPDSMEILPESGQILPDSIENQVRSGH